MAQKLSEDNTEKLQISMKMEWNKIKCETL